MYIRSQVLPATLRWSYWHPFRAYGDRGILTNVGDDTVSLTVSPRGEWNHVEVDVGLRPRGVRDQIGVGRRSGVETSQAYEDRRQAQPESQNPQTTSLNNPTLHHVQFVTSEKSALGRRSVPVPVGGEPQTEVQGPRYTGFSIASHIRQIRVNVSFFLASPRRCPAPHSRL